MNNDHDVALQIRTNSAKERDAIRVRKNTKPLRASSKVFLANQTSNELN